MFPFSAPALPDNKKTTGQPSKPTCRNLKKAVSQNFRKSYKNKI